MGYARSGPARRRKELSWWYVGQCHSHHPVTSQCHVPMNSADVVSGRAALQPLLVELYEMLARVEAKVQARTSTVVKSVSGSMM
jgi:hypothetical protein